MDIIETERLRFRMWQESDADDLFKYASDPDVGERAGWPPHNTKEDSLMVIRDIFSNDHTWALELKETGHVIGCMGYYPYGESNIEIGENDVEVGYWIGKPYWNKGLCTEALRAMIDYCFNTKGFKNIWADFFIDNPASGRVMEKCGFIDTGRTNILSKLYHSDSRPVKIMKLFNWYEAGTEGKPTLLLLPGLGVSYQIYLPLIELLKEKFRIYAFQVDGFTLGRCTRFDSIDGQAGRVIDFIRTQCGGHVDCIYGLSLGGKILSRVLERNEVTIDHAILDAAPLLPLPRWLEGPLRYYQSYNVWTCYHWTGFWRFVFHSHYFDVLLDECRKVFPFGGRRSVLDGYKSVYTNKLEAIYGADIHFWYGTKEAFVAKPQAEHLLKLYPSAHIEVFPKMNHGQMLVDHPDEVANRILSITR